MNKTVTARCGHPVPPDRYTCPTCYPIRRRHGASLAVRRLLWPGRVVLVGSTRYRVGKIRDDARIELRELATGGFRLVTRRWWRARVSAGLLKAWEGDR